VISEHTGVNVLVNRDSAVLQDGDELLIVKLRQRVNPAEKAQNAEKEIGDFEFYRARFSLHAVAFSLLEF